LLGDQRKTANAFRTGWVTNTPKVTPKTANRDVGGVPREELSEAQNSNGDQVLDDFGE
jgi:hypothetical protein